MNIQTIEVFHESNRLFCVKEEIPFDYNNNTHTKT